jgi:hypothetical protein
MRARGLRSFRCGRLPIRYVQDVFQLFRYSVPPLFAAPLYFLGMSLLSVTFTGPILSIIIYVLFFILGVILSKAIIILTTSGLILSLTTFSIVYLKFRYPFLHDFRLSLESAGVSLDRLSLLHPDFFEKYGMEGKSPRLLIKAGDTLFSCKGPSASL